MVGPRNRFLLIQTCALVLIALIVSQGATAGCPPRVFEQDLIVPFGKVVAPPAINEFVGSGFHVLGFWFAVDGATEYSLIATEPQTTLCPGVAPCVWVPDFDISWYNAESLRVKVDRGNGDQVGWAVPSNAAFGYVYMAYGPGVPFDIIPTADFQLTLRC